MKKSVVAMIVLLLFFTGFIGCSRKEVPPQEIKKYPLDGIEGILTKTNVEFDPAVSSDGRGSVRIDAPSPVTVRLYEVRNVDAENARLTYRARLKTQDLEGKVFLEMWCVFPGGGEYFSRAIEAPVTGTTDWVTQETSFFLKEGHRPEIVKLNVVVDGKGTVWVDEITLMKGPLR